MRFYQQECWSGVPFPPPGDLPEPGIEPASLSISCIGRQILYHYCNLESPISFTQIHQLFIFCPISLSFYIPICPSTCPSILHPSLFLFLYHLPIICLDTHTHTHTHSHTRWDREKDFPQNHLNDSKLQIYCLFILNYFSACFPKNKDILFQDHSAMVWRFNIDESLVSNPQPLCRFDQLPHNTLNSHVLSWPSIQSRITCCRLPLHLLIFL